jgi:hypothetical protein
MWLYRNWNHTFAFEMTHTFSEISCSSSAPQIIQCVWLMWSLMWSVSCLWKILVLVNIHHHHQFNFIWDLHIWLFSVCKCLCSPCLSFILWAYSLSHLLNNFGLYMKFTTVISDRFLWINFPLHPYVPLYSQHLLSKVNLLQKIRD